jgi:hypothetical protein
MKLSQAQTCFAFNVSKLIQHIYETDHFCTLGEAFRTKEQAQIYAKQGLGILDSQHCKRLAIDLNLFDSEGNYITNPEQYQPYALFWQSLHPKNRAGYFFPLKDAVHFEMKS